MRATPQEHAARARSVGTGRAERGEPLQAHLNHGVEGALPKLGVSPCEIEGAHRLNGLVGVPEVETTAVVQTWLCLRSWTGLCGGREVGGDIL